MSRNTDLESVLFPVELFPISFTPKPSPEELPGLERKHVNIPRHQAVVRTDNNEVFAVVSNKYKLIRNQQALAWGKQIFQKLFAALDPVEFTVYKIEQTKSGSACHIDLIHKSYNTETWDQETWLPFLRISNSYNRYRALSFDFGFVRSLCSNGIIFHQQTAKAKFYHSKGKLEFDINSQQLLKLRELEAEFATHMKKLHATKVAEENLLPLALHLLELHFDLNHEDPSKQGYAREKLQETAQQLIELQTRYKEEMGATAYTSLNMATDFATHHAKKAGELKTSHALQTSIGSRSQTLLKHLNAQTQLEELILPEINMLSA